MGVIVVGSLNYDLVTYTDRIPEAGETLKAGHFETHAGGKGLNQAVAISRLMSKNKPGSVEMAGNVGDDSFGKELIGILGKNSIGCSAVNVLRDVKTGSATILVELKTGQNRILIAEGANGYTKYTKHELMELFPEKVDKEKEFVVFQNEIPGTLETMHWLSKNRPKNEIVYNPSPFLNISQKEWKLVDVLVVNEIEALQVIECAYGENQLKEIQALISKDNIKAYKTVASKIQNELINPHKMSSVIITLGENGCVYVSKAYKEAGYIEAIKVTKIVDTTGAGDTFLGGVVSQLYQGSDLGECVKFATVASSISIQREGAAESIPDYAEIE